MAPTLVGAISEIIGDVITRFVVVFPQPSFFFFPPLSHSVSGLQCSDFSDVCISFNLKYLVISKNKPK